MADTGAAQLSLRPLPTKVDDPDKVSELIQRLYAQGGHFRKVSEQQLEAEIQSGSEYTSGDAEQSKPEEDEDAEKDSPKTIDDVYKARAKMIESIASAQNDALLALDFVSLLLSKYGSKHAEHSMSPALKQLAPPGTLACDKWPLKIPSDKEKKLQAQVAQGWNISSAENAAETLSRSGTRLAGVVQSETSYWSELMSVVRHNYSVARLHPRRQTYVFGVQVGFMEAGPSFKGQGFATLNRDSNGHITLDQRLGRSPKSVRVQIVKDGVVVGVDTLPPIQAAGEFSLADSVGFARSSLFNEELFHEMSLEARVLYGHNVSLRENTLELGLSERGSSSQLKLVIDLAPRNTAVAQPADQPMKLMARVVALSLRLLLSFSFRQKLQRRSQIPAPMSDRKDQNSPPVILRAILNHFFHHFALQQVHCGLDSLKKILSSASLQLEYSITENRTVFKPSKQQTPRSGGAFSDIEILMNNLTGPLVDTCTLHLPSSKREGDGQGQPLSISARTFTSPQHFGTEYNMTIPNDTTGPLSLSTSNGSSIGSSKSHKRLSFSSFDELLTYLGHVISVDIAHKIVAPIRGGWQGEPGASEVLKKHNAPGNWSILMVDLSRARLRLRACTEANGASEEFKWKVKDNRETRSFHDVATSILG